MLCLLLRRVLLLVVVMMTATSAQAQSMAPPDRPKVAVVLSGGGARGMAHIGALKVLEREGVPVDLVVGTSMGCVLGALYASGHDADALEAIALSEDWAALFNDQPGRRSFAMEEKRWESRYLASLPLEGFRIGLPLGLVTGQRLMNRFTHLINGVHHIEDFSQLPTPLVCLAVDLETGDPVRLENGYLVDAVRASMSIPTVFTPVVLEGRKLVDGGVVRNLPTIDARALGADLVIAVDVSTELKAADEVETLLDVTEQTFDINRRALLEAERAAADVLMTPSIQGIGALDFDDVPDLIRRGERAAWLMMPRVLTLLDSLGVATTEGTVAPPNVLPQRTAFVVTDIVVEGGTPALQSLTRGQLRLAPGQAVTTDELERHIDRLFSTQLFERITYRLQPQDVGVQLILRIAQRTEDSFRFGFQYDSRARATVALNVTFRNALRQAPTLVMEALLGDETRYQFQHYRYLGGRVAVRSRLRYFRATPNVTDVQDRLQQLQFTRWSAEVFLGNSLSQHVQYGFGLEEAYSISSPRIAPEDVETERENLLTAFAALWYDSLDRGDFASAGHHLVLRLAGSERGLGSTSSAVQLRFNWQQARPLSDRLSLLTEFQVITTDAAEDNPNELTVNFGLDPVRLGGAQQPLFTAGTFVGLKQNERIGRHLQAAMLGFQYEIVPRRFLILRANVGNTFNAWTWNPLDEPYVVGAGVTLGGLTPVGPVTLTAAASNEHLLLLDVRLGYRF